MKKTFSIKWLFCLLMLCVSSASLAWAETSISLKKEGYNPAQVYKGSYGTNALYYRNPGSNQWKFGFGKSSFNEWVECRDALKQLGESGLWKGHLKPDGSCGSVAEPSEWALGNRLNYEIAGADFGG